MRVVDRKGREVWDRVLARVVDVLGHESDVDSDEVGREVGLERELVREDAAAAREGQRP